MSKRLLLVVVMAACSPSASPGDESARDEVVVTRDSQAPIQTDSLLYSLKPQDRGWATRIPFEYRNPTSDTIYVVNCNRIVGMDLEQHIGSEWQAIWHPVMPACLSPPIVIAPGAIYADTITIFGARPDTNTEPAFPDTTFTGRYRLVWQGLVRRYRMDSGADFGDPVPLEDRISNEFRFRKETGL